MKCSCCDRDLSDKEIIWNEEIKNWELCTVCLDIAMDAAFSEGFSIEEDPVLDGGFDGFGDETPDFFLPVKNEFFFSYHEQDR